MDGYCDWIIDTELWHHKTLCPSIYRITARHPYAVTGNRFASDVKPKSLLS